MTTNPKSLAYDEENRRLICEIHMDWVSFDDLYVDKDGQKWDICKECGEKEEAHGKASSEEPGSKG